MPHTIIIGGGVIGTACAHYLAEAGHDVTILERDSFAKGCSHGNCGYVSPSHVLPLAEPGAVRKTLRAMLSRNSPFKIRPRLDFTLWAWLARFARRCNQRDMLAAAHAIGPLLDSSIELYRGLIETEPLECEWEERGLLFVYRTESVWQQYSKTNELLAEMFAQPADQLDGKELAALEPALRDDLAGAWYYRDDAHLRADRLMIAWRNRLESRGVTVRERSPVEGFVRSGSAAAGVKTPDGTVEGENIIVATGAWAPKLSQELGIPLPIQPGKGYSLTMPRPAVCPEIPMLFQEDKVGVTPFQSGYRLGSTMEFAGYDESMNPARLKLLTDGAARYLRDPALGKVEERWWGWRPMTVDSLPFIDQAPSWNNIWVAAGHNMLGLSMAPATGRLVAELITGNEPHIDPRPYRLGR